MLNKQDYLDSYNNGWQKVSERRKILQEHNTLFISIHFGGSQSASTTWKYTIDIDDVYMINLTEIFGSGNEPTKAQMDEIFENL